MQQEAFDELKHIDELSDALNTLKILINFGVSTSPEPGQLISDFQRKIFGSQSTTFANMKVNTNAVDRQTDRQTINK